jgi:hypothetical protein
MHRQLKNTLGWLCLGFYALALVDNCCHGVAGDSLWMCHIANLLLGLGLLLDRPRLVGVAILWTLLGCPLWLRELFLDPTILLSSYLAHLGGLAVALWALPRYRGRSFWLWAFALGVAVRALCGWLTPADLNVNVSHATRDGWETVFPDFWQYWIASSLAMGALLYLIERLLRYDRSDRSPSPEPNQ